MTDFNSELELIFNDSSNTHYTPKIRLELCKKNKKNVVYARSITFHESAFDAFNSITAFYGKLTEQILNDVNEFTKFQHELHGAELFIEATNPLA